MSSQAVKPPWTCNVVQKSCERQFECIIIPSPPSPPKSLPFKSVKHPTRKRENIPMLQRSSLTLRFVLLFSLVAQSFGQQAPTNKPPQQRPDIQTDEEVVRITANLVQVDAVVTDKNGKQVTDLRAEDFEVLEDDKPQKITNFSYISCTFITGGSGREQQRRGYPSEECATTSSS